MSLYHKALAADDAWAAELRRLFGKHSGDVRYTNAGKGEPGSTLRHLHDEFRRANEAWMDAMRASVL